jgi:hypothetical protein
MYKGTSAAHFSARGALSALLHNFQDFIDAAYDFSGRPRQGSPFLRATAFRTSRGIFGPINPCGQIIFRPKNTSVLGMIVNLVLYYRVYVKNFAGVVMKLFLYV